MKINNYSICKPINGVCKQHAVWASDIDGSGTWPIIYLQRPKWITNDDDWEKICNSIRLDIPVRFEVS